MLAKSARKSRFRKEFDHDFWAVHAGYELSRGRDRATVGTAGEITVTVRLVFVLITVFPTEAALEKPFTNGMRR